MSTSRPESIEPLRRLIEDHPVYAAIRTPSALAVFAAHHVFAVWDFMSLVKRLQQELTCVNIPWMPPANPTAARLINEIVLGEESDETPSGYRSHYEIYRDAMEEIGAPTLWIDTFLDGLRAGQPLSRALHASGAPDFVIRFVETTFSILETGAIHEVAAVFTFSREDLVPPMFLRVTEECTMHRQSYPNFFYYLDRHIEVDSGSHGPLAHTLLAELCGGDPALLRAAEAAACRALEARLALWDGILSSL